MGRRNSPRIDLSYSEALQYLRHEALRVDAPRGPVTLCYRALPLGLGKGVGTRINNLNPETWRIRTTHTTPFSLLGIDEMKPKGA
jgi:NOL1/NOP2/fmu family ribosome biogenesis protein